MINTLKALLIINAKKGWTDEARKKAALTRKAKAKVAGKASKNDKQKANLYGRADELMRKSMSLTGSKKSAMQAKTQSLLSRTGDLPGGSGKVAKSKYGVGGKNAHKKRVAAYQDAKKARAKLSSQSVKSMTEARKILGLPDYLHKGGSSKAHNEVAKKALSTASYLSDPVAVKRYKDLAKSHKAMAKQFKAHESSNS